MSHTPGPWTTYEYHIVSPDNRILGTVRVENEYGNDPEAAANARLIAAAPELLEAIIPLLENYLSVVEAKMNNEGARGIWDIETAPFVIAGRAAIAKATEQS